MSGIDFDWMKMEIHVLGFDGIFVGVGAVDLYERGK